MNPEYIIEQFFTEGKSAGRSVNEFDPDQILMGIKVEMEHTENPIIALKIACDHLAEIPDYYTRLKKMEDEAKSEMESPEEEEPFIIK